MKITFLGTSHGVPSDTRFCSGILIQVKDAYYFLDGGAPLADLVMRYQVPTEKIKGAFVTHMHGDHTWGLFHLLDLINWKWTDCSLDVLLPEQCGIDSLKQIEEVVCHPLDEKRIRFSLTHPGKVFEDGIITMTAIPTQHMPNNRPSFAYLMEAEGKCVLFTGDMAADMEDFPQIALDEATDCIVCEAAHQAAETTLNKARRCPTGHFLITHVYPDEKFPIFEAAAKEMPFDFRTVKDGDSIQL